MFMAKKAKFDLFSANSGSGMASPLVEISDPKTYVALAYTPPGRESGEPLPLLLY